MKNEMRFGRCVRYNLKGLIRPTLIYLGIFVLIDLILPIVVYFIFGESIRSGQSTFSYGIDVGMPGSLPFPLATMIFLFVSAYLSFRETFNQLLLLNNTRLNQFWAMLVSMIAASAALVVFDVIIGWAETLIQAMIDQRSASDSLAAVFQWYGDNFGGMLVGLLACLAVFLTAFAFGEVAGILSYRFGNLFTVPFWICFGASFIAVPIMIGTTSWFGKFFFWFIGYQQANQALVLALHLLGIAVIFKALTFVTIRKLNQTA